MKECACGHLAPTAKLLLEHAGEEDNFCCIFGVGKLGAISCALVVEH